MAWPDISAGIRRWLAADQLETLLLAVALALLLALAWLAARRYKLRQIQRVLAALDDTTFGRVQPRVRTGHWGFGVDVAPAPEPFVEFSVSYLPLSILDPLDLGRRLVERSRTRLQFAGTLAQAPENELVWTRRQMPARVLGRSPGREHWIFQRTDLTRTEYAVRGTNPAPVAHTFSELSARYVATLQHVSIRKERRPHVRLVLEGNIDPQEISPLITLARALGRGAVLG